MKIHAVCFISCVLSNGRTFTHTSKALSQQNQTHLKYFKTKSNKNLCKWDGGEEKEGGGWGWGEEGWREVGDLAFGSRVLAQEGGDGAGFGDLLGERALHVFDGWVGSGVQQELHDVGKLAS